MASLVDTTTPDNSVMLFYKTENIAMTGVFPGTESIQVTRIGNVVYMSTDKKLTHASGTVRSSGTGLIPTWARPGAAQDDQGPRMATAVVESADLVVQAWVSANGVFNLSYMTLSSGGSQARTDSAVPVSSYYRIE